MSVVNQNFTTVITLQFTTHSLVTVRVIRLLMKVTNDQNERSLSWPIVPMMSQFWTHVCNSMWIPDNS